MNKTRLPLNILTGLYFFCAFMTGWHLFTNGLVALGYAALAVVCLVCRTKELKRVRKIEREQAEA